MGSPEISMDDSLMMLTLFDNSFIFVVDILKFLGDSWKVPDFLGELCAQSEDILKRSSDDFVHMLSTIFG